MSLKIEFVERATQPGAKLAPLCREFSISRPTGMKWVRRFREEGYEGLEERSRRPATSPLAKPEELILAIVESREAHPSWGPRKLRTLLQRRFKAETPSASTIARVLRRFDKIRRRPKSKTVSVVGEAPSAKAAAPNELWTVDFKGWWRTKDGERFEPLTVRDACSRFVLCLTVVRDTTVEGVRSEFQKLFERYGVPSAILCDNGSPFISTSSRGGLTRLSTWWVSLGIKLVRSRVGCPQDNGGHERMHRDVSIDLESCPSEDQASQQRACDRWKQEFNHVRPHAAIDNAVPADLYRPSPIRPRVRRAVYAPTVVVRSISASGHFYWQGEGVFVSRALGRQRIGLEPLGGLRWRVWFFDLDLGEIELVPRLDDFVPPEYRTDEKPNAMHDARPRGTRPGAHSRRPSAKQT